MVQRRAPETIETIEASLLNAALALSESWDRVSMPDLAKAADIAVGTLYRIAPSKQILGQRLEVLARQAFDSHVFASFPARLTLQERFDLIWLRMGEFALTHGDIARFLASRAWPSDCAFIRASEIFARDGQTSGVLKPLTGPLVAALVWGPLASLLRDGACSRDSLIRLQKAAWDGLRA
jgi:AcrR family transcriptional regulator